MVAIDPTTHAPKSIDPDSDYVSSNAALEILGVKPQTLYSYVSRGLVRRLSNPAERTSYYHRHDIQRLKARSIARSGHGPAAASAMHWGEPILETAITEITPQGPRYRQHLAIDLAGQGYSFETVAEYLWGGRLGAKQVAWSGDRLPHAASFSMGSSRKRKGAHFRHALTRTLAILDQTASNRQSHLEESPSASDIIRAMTSAFGFLGSRHAATALKAEDGIAHGLARSLGVRANAENLHAINAALVLLADHELTSPTFVARISASVGSDLNSCVIAALQVHFGSVLALCSDRLEDLVDTVFQKTRPSAKLSSSLTMMRSTPGFQHPLYAHGDPRARMLLDLALSLKGGRKAATDCLGALEKLLPDMRHQPHLSEALVVLCRALGMKHQAAGGLLALGRSAGWIAHVIEQRQQGFIIRPRGKFLAGP